MGIIKRLWRAGKDTLAITITKDEREALKLEEGDLVEINDIKKIGKTDEQPKTEEDENIVREKIKFK